MNDQVEPEQVGAVHDRLGGRDLENVCDVVLVGAVHDGHGGHFIMLLFIIRSCLNRLGLVMIDKDAAKEVMMVYKYELVNVTKKVPFCTHVWIRHGQRSTYL